MQKANFISFVAIRRLACLFAVLIGATFAARTVTPIALMALSSAIAYDELPARFPFLFFPRPDCDVNQSSGEKCPSRAVLVSKEEYESGKVQFTDTEGNENWIASSELSLLPKNNEMQFLRNWKEHMLVADDTDGEWASREGGSGEFEIRVSLTDHQFSRYEEYRYIVKHGKVISARNIFFGAIDLLVSTVILTVGIICFLFLMRFVGAARRRKLISGV